MKIIMNILNRRKVPRLSEHTPLQRMLFNDQVRQRVPQRIKDDPFTLCLNEGTGAWSEWCGVTWIRKRHEDSI
jgi:hypothetical protein